MATNVRDSGIYTFRAQGIMYHNIKSFGREGGAEHKHLELYFYNDDPSLEHRYRKCREEQLQKDKEVIKQIVGILCGTHTPNTLGAWAILKTLMTIISH
jgi:hypothetical protein